MAAARSLEDHCHHYGNDNDITIVEYSTKRQEGKSIKTPNYLCSSKNRLGTKTCRFAVVSHLVCSGWSCLNREGAFLQGEEMQQAIEREGLG